MAGRFGQHRAEHNQMLVLEHANGNPVQVESVQEVLDALLARQINIPSLFQFDQALGHCLKDYDSIWKCHFVYSINLHNRAVPFQYCLQLVIEPEQQECKKAGKLCDPLVNFLAVTVCIFINE